MKILMKITSTAYITFLKCPQQHWCHVKKQCGPSAIYTVSVGAKEQIVHSTLLCNTYKVNNMW